MNEQRINCLLIEDDPVFGRLLEEMLATSGTIQFHLLRVALLADGLNRLAQGGIDVVVLDLVLPDSNGLNTFVRTHTQAPRVPIVVLTGRDDDEIISKVMQAGAQDYLLKSDIEPKLLVRSIRYAIERKRAEEELTRERDLLHTLLNSLPDRIYFKDTESRFTRINPALAKLFHLSDPGQAVGKSDFDFFSGEHAQKAFRDEQELLRTAVNLVSKVEKETMPDGRVLWVLTTKVPIRDTQGRVTGTVGISKDITHLKQMEDDLRQREEQYRSLINNIPNVTWTSNQEGRTLFISPNVEQIYGYSPDEICRAGVSLWYDYIHPDDLLRVKEALALLFAENKPFDVEYRAQRKDGRWVWIHDRAIATYEREGKQYADGVFSDITDRKEIELALRENEQRYRLLFERNPEPMWVYDLVTLEFLDVNQAAVDLYGYSREEFLAMSIKAIRPPEEVPALMKKLEGLPPGVDYAGPWRHQKKDGTIIDVEIVTNDVEYAGRRARHVLATDITERLRSERQMQATVAELSATRLQLIHAEKMETIGRFAAGVAHEVKNPLATILMGTEYLSDSLNPNDPNAKDVLAGMREAVERADATVRDLLNFAAPTKFDFREQDLNPVVEHALALIRHGSVKSHIVVLKELGEHLPLLSLDRSKIEQVFVNLCLNAIQVMADGGTICVRTFTRQLDANKLAVVAEFDDTGPGIPEHVRVKLFDPFFTTKMAEGGTGLGLVVCKQIVEAHGGTISLMNRPEGGARATITFPSERKQ